MKELTEQMLDVLLDLFDASGEEANQFLIVMDVHHATLDALRKRNLVKVDEKYDNTGKKQRYAALTPRGIKLGINAKSGSWHLVPSRKTYPSEKQRRRLTHALQFDINKREHDEAEQVVQRLKSNRSFTDTVVRLLLFFDAVSESQDIISEFENYFPDIAIQAHGRFFSRDEMASVLRDVIESSSGNLSQLNNVSHTAADKSSSSYSALGNFDDIELEVSNKEGSDDDVENLLDSLLGA